MIKDVSDDVLPRLGIRAKKETPPNFLTLCGEIRSTFRPDNVLVYRIDGEKYTYVDITGVRRIW